MAETIRIDIPHKLSRAEARQRIAEGFGRMRQEVMGGMIKWEDQWSDDHLDFRARVMGQTVTGRLDVRDTDVHVEVDLPMFLAALAEKVKGRLAREAQVLLEKK